MKNRAIEGVGEVPTPNDVIRELWRRVQETKDDKVAFKGMEEILKWQKMRDQGGSGRA
ncbi:hypothetical protein VK792_19295 [Mesobacterium sp. TK19101]|uniref:Uncharacterized protein n=1 Tax=Mesobacterium hydrothermale TaxID=3111907 RepID=A0ABU6HM80_9RHOB|nr:hypothetical protein [Mesobacterium sp. TK19101]MEC3863431.1 hypothetical protein [Mesobacterium sp. TK19101]